MFGGFEYDGEVALNIALTISAACASTAGPSTARVSNGVVARPLAHRGQRELWEGGRRPHLSCRLLATARPVPDAGGYRLNGTCPRSGCDIAQWGQLGAMITRVPGL